MSKFIVSKTVKSIEDNGKDIDKSRILILGVTFKENCPDMRNSKVIDIIEGLKELNMAVDIYDPWVNISKERKWYKHGIIDDPLTSKIKYDAIIVAVSHDLFKEYRPIDFEKLSNGPKVIIDIKSIVDNPTWRL